MFVLVIVICIFTGTAGAATYYFDADNGNDTTGDGSSSNPWKSLTKAQTVLQEGDTGLFRTGSYGAFYDLSGSVRSNWIAYKADTGHTPIFSMIDIRARALYLKFDGITVTPGDATAQYRNIMIYNASYVQVLNCTITGPGIDVYKLADAESYGVKIQSGSNCLIQDCNITGYKYGVAGIQLSSTTPSYISVLNNTIHDCRFGVQALGSFWDVSNNNVYNIGSDGIFVNCIDSTINHNHVYNLERTVTYTAEGNYTYHSSNHTITWNSGDKFTTWLTSSADYLHYIIITVNGTRYSSTTAGSWQDIRTDAYGNGNIVDAETLLLCIAIPLGAWSGYTGGDLTITKIEGTADWHNDGIQLQHTESQTNLQSPRPLRVMIDGNRIHNLSLNPGGGGQGFHSDTYEDSPYNNITVQNNLIYNALTLGYQINFSYVNTRQTGWIFRNNVDAGDGGVLATKSSQFKGTNFTNFSGNLIANAAIFLTVGTGNCNPSPYNCTIDYFHNNYTVDEWWGATCKAVSGAFPADNVVLTYTNFKALFNNYDSDDFTLASGSAAINKGVAAYAPATDILGNSRDSSPDAGCYEYISAQTYTLNTTAVNGTVAKSPDKASYNSGETVTLQATPNTGYDFANWSGDASGTNSSVTITMNSTKSVTANFAVHTPTTYTMSITATNGSVSKTPNKSSYNHGETLTLVATANTGYHFSNWSGDASGTNSTTTIVMNSNKSITANFSLNAYSLTVTSSNGSVTKTLDKSSYNYSEQVILQATPATGYHFSSWSGNASGTNSSTTITMNADKTVTANFAINTYTLDVTAIFGSVTKTPSKTLYNYGETVTIQAVPSDGYAFTAWVGDASGSSNPVTTFVMDSNKSITANFVYMLVDKIPPSTTGYSPQPGSIQVPLNSLVTLHVTDAGEGIDPATVTIKVNNNIVYSGNTAKYTSSYGNCYRTGTAADYTFTYQSSEMLDYDQSMTVAVNAADLAENVMSEYSFSFETEMRSFGENKKVNSSGLDNNKGKPVTVRDSAGNIWTAWHAGQTGSRDIYVGKLAAGGNYFSDSIKLSSSTCDKCNPAIALGSDNKLYVAWQDNRRGNWDIYVSSSTDGTNWSAERRITDSNDNQVNPVMVIDGSSPNKVYVAWEDDRHGNWDIYAASSNNGFVSKTVSQITSDSANQTEPAIAADSANTIYIVWTDARNGTNDIYGACSANGPWTNVAIVNKAYSQSSPAIATESAGSILHFLWVDDSSGNKDIYYCSSNGMPSVPLSGSSIIDDSTGADQLSPVISTTGSTGNNLRVFACWQDKRNIVGNSTDTDLYFAKINPGCGTNVLVDEDNTNADQSEPAMATDIYGNPYLVWTDDRNTYTDIYYAGNTFIESNALASKDIAIASDTTVGTELSAITSEDDVSVMVPAGAYSCGVEITISRVKNPQKLSTERFSLPYEFGPSGIDFAEPVTVTIPYDVSDSSKIASAYWYNPLTGMLSQQGITDVETIIISPTLHALRFKTAHFTQFFVGGAVIAAAAGGGGGGGGGGGCSMSPNSQGSIAELLLPYVGLTVVMIILKLRDVRKRKVHNTTESEC